MQWFDPDDNSQPIITPQKQIGDTLNKHRISPKVMMLETANDISRIKNNFSIEESSFPIRAFSGKRSFYFLNENLKIALIERNFTAPGAVDVLETIIAMGCKQLFLFGLCGAVGNNVEVGDVIIPTEITREEGVSYHYAPSGINAKPDTNLKDELERYIKTKNSLSVHVGKTVTTDAVFRQTLNKELNWRANGILGVDMEMSALLTVAHYSKIPAVSLLVVSDKHVLKENSEWHWGGQALEEKRIIALTHFVQFAKII